MTRPDRAERRAARRAEKRAWVREHRRGLIVFFAALMAVGLIVGAVALVVAAYVGVVWVLVASR